VLRVTDPRSGSFNGARLCEPQHADGQGEIKGVLWRGYAKCLLRVTDPRSGSFNGARLCEPQHADGQGEIKGVLWRGYAKCLLRVTDPRSCSFNGARLCEPQHADDQGEIKGVLWRGNARCVLRVADPRFGAVFGCARWRSQCDFPVDFLRPMTVNGLTMTSGQIQMTDDPLPRDPVMTPVPKTSRREFLAGMALLGAASLAGASAGSVPAPAGQPLPGSPWPAGARKEAAGQLLNYFGKTAPQLLRPAQGVLTHPSIAGSLPGRRYATNLWDWDTYWTARGLFRFATLANDPALRSSVGGHAIGSFLNFFDHQSDEGRLPILIDVHNPDPLGCLKPDRPKSQNQAKPVFGQLALLIAGELGSVDWLAPHFDKLQRFYAAWVSGNQSAIGLLVWGNDVAIGNDNDPTTFGRPFFSSANLLLNCLFHADLQAAAELAGRLKRPADQQRLGAQARTLGEQIQKCCWDPRDRFYYTADVQCVDRRRELIPNVKPGMEMSWHSLPLRVQTFTGFLPLWCGLATPEQARALVQANYRADDRFCANWGVRSLSSRESMYCLDFSSNPSNWLGPVWIIVNYLVWKALKDYGFQAEAGRLADQTLRLLSTDLAANGSLNEYYHPDTGLALSHKGFMDWNLLVLEMM
jgi:putative isomerase